MSRGLDNRAIGGSELFHNGTEEEIAGLLNLNVLKEIAPAEEIFCNHQCECDENLLLVEILDDHRARLSCPSGQVPSEEIPISEVRRFRFSRNDFLAWICRENEYHSIPGRNQEVCDRIYHFADTTILERNLSLCIVMGSVRVNPFEKLLHLSDIFSLQPVVAFTSSDPPLRRGHIKSLTEKNVFPRSFVDVIKSPVPRIDLDFIERQWLDQERIRRPSLILQLIPTGPKHRLATELVGKRIGNRSIPLGRFELLIIYALLNARVADHEDKLVHILPEKDLVRQFLEWRRKGWITANLGPTEKPEHRLTKGWGRFIRQMKRFNLEDLFIRRDDNRNIKYILTLDSKEAVCQIPDIATAVKLTADTGRRVHMI